MKYWFVADTHFGQQRTLELSRRPFASVWQMDNIMVDRWNQTVGAEDTVFHLGDFGNPTTIGRLNGKTIHLVPGNYDTPDVLQELQRDDRVRVRRKLVVLAAPEVNLPRLHLIHEPERGLDPAAFYLFGHIHQLQMVKRNGLNVGVDCHRFRPIGLDVVKFYYDAVQQHYDENVFMEEIGE